MNSTTIYLLALASNLLFSTTSLIFAVYSTRFSPMWMNQTKVLLATLAFGLTSLFFPLPADWNLSSFGFLGLSGLLGLCLGDFLLFKAYTKLGPARSLILFSFQPLILGVFAFLTLNQKISAAQFGAILCMIICIFIYIWERFKTTGQWDLKSFLWALLGITLDAIGIMLTRSAYENTPELHSSLVNFVRCLGAILGFFFINPKFFAEWVKSFFNLEAKSKITLVAATFTGTYLSLMLYLSALKYAHLATLTSIAITGPLWVSFLECLWYRRLPNLYQWLGMIFFIVGFYLMT